MVAIKSGGRQPAADGDINLYESPELKEKQKYFQRGRRVIFVNGMDNSPANHKTSADVLSTLQACPVIGVYNKTDGFWLDLGQCILDKATLVPVQAEQLMGFESWVGAVDGAYRAAKAASPGLTKGEFVEQLIATNPATVALYRLLRSDRVGPKTPIFAHSQGNLITSNALTAVALADGESAISDHEVHSFGSPCRFWPPGITHLNHAFTFDPVGWMDYKFSLSSIKVGGVLAHGFDEYVKYDPEFVINRFRWGSFGFTANMDERGLASALVDMGANPKRLQGIFKRLHNAHWSDQDDVTLLYVKAMRSRGREGTLKSMARAKPDLIKTMVECLVGGAGWNTAEEKQTAEYLKAL